MRVFRAGFLCEPSGPCHARKWEEGAGKGLNLAIRGKVSRMPPTSGRPRAQATEPSGRGTGLPVYPSSRRTGKEKGAELPNHVPDLYEHLGIISHSTKAWGKVPPLLSHP